jgi:RNA polymerase sigma-70 factor, ECF subfamily
MGGFLVTSRRKRKESTRRLTPPPELSEFAQIAYSELRRMAGSYFKSERTDHTLQPTALVHEVYIRLAKGGPKAYVNRAHFFSTAARAMRELLVDYARAHNAKKRSGKSPRVALDALQAPAQELPDYPAIDAALKRLAAVHSSRFVQIAEMRIFAGLSNHEVAKTLGLAPSSVRVYWAKARTFLEKQLEKS